MKGLSPAAQKYVSGMILIGLVVSVWELTRLPREHWWVWPILAIPAVFTLRLKHPESTVPYQRLVSLMLIAFGLVIAVWQLPHLPEQNLWMWLGLGAIAAATHILKQEGPTARSSYQISFMVYGFTFVLLGAPATVFIILIAHFLEYTWGEYYPWYIQSFNMANFAISISAAGLVYELVNPERSLLAIYSTVGILAALAVFTMLNHMLIGFVLRLARGQSFAQSGVFGFLTLMIDFGLLCMGAGAALIWNLTPFGIVLSLIPLYLIHSTLRLPALERRSETDAKTGLYNSAHFSKAATMELERAQRFDRPLTIVMADLDLLRNINNTFGHLAGDVVLSGVAQIMMETVRDYDVVSRFGGEEFAILMPETTAEEALPLVESIRTAVESAAFTVPTSVKPIKATLSLGIASRAGADQTLDSLIHSADLALYQAKDQGRNLVLIYSPNGKNPLRTVPMLQPKFTDGAVAAQRKGEVERLAKEVLGVTSGRLANETPEATASTAAANQTSEWRVDGYIAVVAILATALSVLLLRDIPSLDWLGLAAFALVALLSEFMSLEIYVRETVVSTSVAALVAGALLFGPVGAVVLGITVALANYVKNRSRMNRFVFNAGNFIIGNLICVALILAVGQPISELNIGLQFSLSMISTLVNYLSTTFLLAGVVSINTGQSAGSIWVERFRWLAPYYAALGVVAFALLFCYILAGYVGVFVILVPLFMLRFSQKQYIDHTKAMVARLRRTNEELSIQSEEITLLNEELLLTLARSVDLRDPFVMEHSRHVSRYAILTARELGLSDDRIDLIRKAGLLHDIGKLGIPEAILFKPGVLSQEEYATVKVHVMIGADLIFGCHSLHQLIPFVKHHHEHYDGGGYPEGLSGEDIPLEARILGLADAVEAMASDRPYKRALSAEAILEEIQRQSGRQFDPKVAEAFTNVVRRKGAAVIMNSARNVDARQEWTDHRLSEPA